MSTMSFEEWWGANKQYWVGSSLPAIEAAKAAWAAGYQACMNGYLETFNKE
jgi:hypothetical protein